MSEEMVTVGCRIPSGLTIRVTEPETVRVATMGGAVAEVRQREVWRATLRGPMQDAVDRAAGETPRSIIGGAAYTDVPRDRWLQFVEQVGPDFAPLASRAIFASPTLGDAKAAAREVAGEVVGLEPINMSTRVMRDGRGVAHEVVVDPRVPRRADGLSAIEPGDGRS